MTTHPGFSDPVLDSQSCFRAVLDAVARPGSIHRVAAPHQAPAPLDRATAAVLLTLADVDTPLFLPPGAKAAAGWIAFHCGAALAPTDTAAFVLAIGSCPLEAVHAGTDLVPEGGATLIVQVTALGSGRAFTLRGPGIETTTTVRIDGLPADFVARWAANCARFPRGVDLILCAGDQLAALPRTTRVQET